MSTPWNDLQQRITACEQCPRLRAHCRKVAQEKRAAYREWKYWGKPVPNLGETTARLLILGLAPAAHGANRTGRMFTGDRSGDFLFSALHATGWATQATSVRQGDGLQLLDAVITATAHCAPPDNHPTREELDHCRDYLRETLDLMPQLRGVVVLGRIAFDAAVRLFKEHAWWPDSVKPEFGHGKLYDFTPNPFLLCSYHPSQQNTFTGRLTPPMLRQIFTTARRLLDTRRR